MEIRKILIANRGEIALRVIRTCKEMGIKTVALCPQRGQEEQFLETRLADEFYFLNRRRAKGYVDQKRIIEIAEKAKVDAIHCGYGFLAENWRFAKLCEERGIKFIGPHFKVLKELEDKIRAKKIAQKVGIPVLLGSNGSIKAKDELLRWALRLKPPFVLKARRGGGGVGIRVVDGEKSLEDIFYLSESIKRQSTSALYDTEFFIEKLLSPARHIEFQILGDGERFLHLGERECSIQRRFQKLFEESPSPFIDERGREEMGDLATKLAEELRYEGIATVEFLMDEDKNFYFLEVNPRLQVEHPVTEAVTGFDLVEQQIRIAQGEKIDFSQDDISLNGWGVEARINAEDPTKNFLPSCGKVEKYLPPGGQGIFLHTFLQPGQEIYPYFDPLLAKLVAHGKGRREALSKLKWAIEEFVIEGIATTIPFIKALLEDEGFLKGDFTTDFIAKSGILERISPPPKRVFKDEKIGERELAEIVFQIYQALSSEIRQKEVLIEERPSNWVMAERLKILEPL